MKLALFVALAGMVGCRANHYAKLLVGTRSEFTSSDFSAHVLVDHDQGDRVVACLSTDAKRMCVWKPRANGRCYVEDKPMSRSKP